MPDLSGLTEKQRLRFVEIHDVIIPYLAGKNVHLPIKMARLSYVELGRRIGRCVSFDSEGRMLGWYGLLPGTHVTAYERKTVASGRVALAQGGYSGALGAIMRTHPDVEVHLAQYLLTARRDHALPESRVAMKDAHQYFLSLCKEQGVVANDWPFCVEHQGVRSLTKWVNAFYARHYDAIVERQYGGVAKVKAATGTGLCSRLRARMPLDIVEMDEHVLDFFACLAIPTPKGVRHVKIRRLSIILVVDRFSEAILAYTVIVRRKVNAADIVATVAKALGRWIPRVMSLPGFDTVRRGGMPSELIEALASCGFNVLLMDNDSAHLAEASLSRIGEMAGCAINYGKVAHFERRPFVELINHRLEIAFQRLPSTTGSGPTDPRRKGAEDKAVTFQIELQAVLDLIDAVISDYNTSLPAGNLGATPLEILQHYVEDTSIGFLPPVLPPPLPGMPPLGLMIENVRVAGSLSRGEKPHINFDRAKYMAPWLSERMDLLGELVQLHINEDDISSVFVVAPDGRPLGLVDAKGVWAGASHSREMRRLINAAIDTGQMCRRVNTCIVSDWLSRVSRTALARGKKGDHVAAAEAANQLAEAARLGHALVSREPGPTEDPPAGPVTSATPGCAPPIASVKTASDAAKACTIVPVASFFAIN
ncbi:hypothetical protein PY254_10965 [Rhodanobacter sp. AS-Z3]|uniref:hypothetical protein n=1 Tax=Rhodanobacter sp. AS-Z3 TaxID=3031330 RepID=UPI002479B2D2|nr:hypothetical protein [Rhodanobacter sp. AS-Z3]WEN13765.1 hypothetical protein PY254_10965 [Rhodanobacter sp. AS-Z3]